MREFNARHRNMPPYMYEKEWTLYNSMPAVLRRTVTHNALQRHILLLKKVQNQRANFKGQTLLLLTMRSCKDLHVLNGTHI